jgi:hypothetical protein
LEVVAKPDRLGKDTEKSKPEESYFTLLVLTPFYVLPSIDGGYAKNFKE